MIGFRPLLAASIDNEEQLKTLSYPMVASPKIDGIRVLCHPTLGPCTRSLKPVRNKYVNSVLSNPLLRWLDGEVVVGPISAIDVFNRSTAIMAGDGEPPFTYWVFDSFLNKDTTYVYRLSNVHEAVGMLGPPGELVVKTLPFLQVHSPLDILRCEEQWLSQGFEGVMLRSPSGRYKFNRSTLKEQILLKLKRFQDTEATVVGFEALERNQNEARTNVLGLTERSSSKEGKVADSTLGKLLVEHPSFEPFSIGSGFGSSLRQEIWDNQSRYLGQKVKFKYLPIGTMHKPRHPIFLGFRPQE